MVMQQMREEEDAICNGLCVEMMTKLTVVKRRCGLWWLLLQSGACPSPFSRGCSGGR